MLTPDEKQEFAERYRESLTKVGEASRQGADACLLAMTAWQRMMDKPFAFTEELGRGNLTPEEIIDYLESKGRKSELAEYRSMAAAALEADQEAEKARTEGAIAAARAETFLADAINQGFLDKDDKEFAPKLKGLRKIVDFLRELRESVFVRELIESVRVLPGSEQALR